MDIESFKELEFKYGLLLRFITNVASGGIGIFDDNETRVQFEKIYDDFEKLINDPDMSMYAPPMPHLGRYVDSIPLKAQHQVLIVHHGTLLLEYLKGILETYKQNIPSNTNKQNRTPVFYVNLDRILELKRIKSNSYDLTKLIRLCEEININFSVDCLYTVGVLNRIIIDHVPPIFGCKSFTEVVNNNKLSKSTREMLENFEKLSRKIADTYIHTQIRKTESLPTQNQVNFSQGLDYLLGEIIRIIEEEEKDVPQKKLVGSG